MYHFKSLQHVAHYLAQTRCPNKTQQTSDLNSRNVRCELEQFKMWVDSAIIFCRHETLCYDHTLSLAYEIMGWRYKPGRTPIKHRRRKSVPHHVRNLSGRSFNRFLQRSIVNVYKFMRAEAVNGGPIIPYKEVMWVPARFSDVVKVSCGS